MLVDPELVKTYRKDTKTVREATPDELTLVKSLLFSTIEKTKTDYENGVFKNYTPYTTSINETLNTIDEAISFNAFHEGIHLGYILAMKNSL